MREPTDRRTRRAFLGETTTGVMSLAVAARAGREARAHASAAASLRSVAVAPPHRPARAVIWLQMAGGPSQVDLLDPKPLLRRYDGRLLPMVVDGVQGRVMASPFRFARHGASGLALSELFDHLSAHADRLAVVRSMQTPFVEHGPALRAMHVGSSAGAQTALGSRVAHALAGDADDVPGFVALADPRGEPVVADDCRHAGLLPAAYDGVALNVEADPTELAATLGRHEASFGAHSAAVDAFALSAEPRAMQALYGIDDRVTESFARQCLVARRLVERGVSFVQLYHGFGPLGDSWDAHYDLRRNHARRAAEVDRPIAALLTDLERTRLLETTIVVWAGEFGRLPVSSSGDGRDHNPHAFSVWLAGGGVRGGQVVGATDPFGLRAVDAPHTIDDLHATILHQLGVTPASRGRAIDAILA